MEVGEEEVCEEKKRRSHNQILSPVRQNYTQINYHDHSPYIYSNLRIYLSVLWLSVRQLMDFD